MKAPVGPAEWNPASIAWQARSAAALLPRLLRASAYACRALAIAEYLRKIVPGEQPRDNGTGPSRVIVSGTYLRDTDQRKVTDVEAPLLSVTVTIAVVLPGLPVVPVMVPVDELIANPTGNPVAAYVIESPSMSVA